MPSPKRPNSRKPSSRKTVAAAKTAGPRRFPFSAIVGQDGLKQALMIAAVEPAIGGVLAFGDRGTGKSTAIRALAGLLPPIRCMVGCPYRSAPEDPFEGFEGAAVEEQPVPVVDLPLGATEDRVVGALDLERALATGEKRFEPGLLARANRGFLYIDEVNLLEDHLIDLLLDVAASGENVVEREGLSLRHPARFVLVGSGNPEEGELRPQLLDRFGLSVEVLTPRSVPERVEVVKRRDAFEHDPAGFMDEWAGAEAKLSKALARARDRLHKVVLPDELREAAATLCLALGTDGLRGELTLLRAARAIAALEGRKAADMAQMARAAPMALGHRLRRDPLDETAAGARVARAVDEVLGTALGAAASA
ncbi:MAG: magnesium chelatase ATPase subunit I [Pseudomonadota bacterium]